MIPAALRLLLEINVDEEGNGFGIDIFVLAVLFKIIVEDIVEVPLAAVVFVELCIIEQSYN